MITDISENGLELIKRFEGYCSKAYRCAAGVLTIGYGTTNADSSIIGVKIKANSKIDRETAQRWLKTTIRKKYAPKVYKYDKQYNWTQEEFDALVSFAYNIGSIDQLTANGTRSRKVIAEKFTAYCKAGGKVNAGLLKRREDEKKLFLSNPGKVDICPYVEPSVIITSDSTAKERNITTYISRGEGVKWWQWLLKHTVESNLVIDGIYGEKTSAATKKLQKKTNVTVDNLVGPKTRAAGKKLL